MLAFSGQQIVAHRHEGSTDYLLVTFCQLNSEHVATDHYFLQAQVEHGDISCIGVMTRQRGFYLSSEMDTVVRLVDEARRGRPVIVFGQSMGGYGALKHSAAIGADVVLALSPFYSMDPDDLELPSERYRKVMMHNMAHHGITWRPEFAGMAIKPADVRGRLVVVHDPSEFIDAYNAGLMRKYLPGIEVVTVPHAGHVIYDPAWDAPTIATLMRNALSSDPALIGRAFTRLRRNHINFMRRSLEKAAVRKPLLCASAMRSPRVTAHPEFLGLAVDPFNLKLVHALCARGERVAAIDYLAYIEWALHRLRPQAVEIVEGDPIAMLERHPCLLLSQYGTFAAYDFARGVIRFEPHVFNRGDLLPITVNIENGVTVFGVLQPGMTQPSILPVDDTAPELARSMVAAGDHQVALRRGDTYLGTTPTGELHILDRVGHQQRFVPLPLLVVASDATAATPAGPVVPRPNFAIRSGAVAHPNFDPRSGNRWRKLFKTG